MKVYKAYTSNDEIVSIIEQCGEWIHDHASDLVGKVIGNDLNCSLVEVKINIAPGVVPEIQVRKNHVMKITVPYDKEP